MFYPAHINLQDRKCLVVGGGPVAERKIVAMLISGGDVTVISPDATELLTYLAQMGTIRWHKRQLRAGDTHGYFLVCAATDFTDINSAVFEEAYGKHKIRLVNVVDVIPQCTFAAASVVTDGELMLSISTSGKSPAMSRRIREHLEKVLHAASLYTLGYEEGEPVPIANQGLPYPVYFLLKGRTCIVVSEQKTPEIEHRTSLLNRCGAPTIHIGSDELKPHHLKDAFLVVADNISIVDAVSKGENGFISECLNEPRAGSYFTPDLVIDDNLIISVSPRNSIGIDKARCLHKKLANQFENNGYGPFIEFLGTLRPQVLKTFPTSKKRAEFFDTLIDTVEQESPQPQRCCFRLANHDCSAECLFNWIQQGKLERADTFTAELLATHRSKSFNSP